MGVFKDIISSIMPFAILGGIVLVAYKYRGKIWEFIENKVLPDSVTTPASEISKTGTSDTIINWYVGTNKDYGLGYQMDPNAPLSGDPNKGVLQAQFEMWYAMLQEKMGKSSTTPVAALDTTPTIVNPVVTPTENFYNPVVTPVVIQESTFPTEPAPIQTVQGVPVGSYADTGATPGQATEAVLQANRALYNELPTSYGDIRHLDVNPFTTIFSGTAWEMPVPIVEYTTGFDYISPTGKEALRITPEGWGLYKWYTNLYGKSYWQPVSVAGGSQVAVWHDPSFIGALRIMGINDWRFPS